MPKVKILVVEDEIVIAANICDSLEELGYEAFAPAINYSQAVKQLETETPDIVILDIQLAGSKDGIDLAWHIKENYDIPFIFLTSNSDPATVERVKKLTPPAYLVKPFVKADLYTSIELALYNHYGSNYTKKETEQDEIMIADGIFIKQKQSFSKILFEDILYLRAEHVYVELNMVKGKKHLVRNSMNAICENLSDRFFRVHRQYAINMKYLQRIDKLHVYVADTEIPIGRNYRDLLLTKIRVE